MAVWLVVTYLTRPVNESVLVEFIHRVRPGSPGWAQICRRHGIEQAPFLRRALGRWLLGLVGLFGLNFGIGSLLLGRPGVGAALVTVALAALAWLVRGPLVARHAWVSASS